MIKQTNLSAKYSLLSPPKPSLGLNSVSKLATAEDTDYNKGGILGGVKFVAGQAGAGALGVLEGIYDYAVGGLSKLVGNDQYARQLMDNDISGGISQRLYQEYNPDKSMQFVGNVASGVGQSLVGMTVAAGAAAISGGTLAPVAISLISGATIGLGAAGKSTAEAYKKTGELGGREFLYGGLSGLLEGGLEAATGAAGKVAGRIASPFAKATAKTAVRQGILKTMIKDGAGEFIEESVSTIIDPYLQRGLKIDENAENATMQEILYSGMVGFTSGAILGGGSTAITNTQKTLIGDKVIKNGNAQKLVENARQTVSTATENKKIQEQIKSLQATLNSYDALADKSGAKGKLLIGELSQGLAVTDVSIAVEEIKQTIIANAEQYAAIAQSAGNNITAEALRTDKKDIATKLAIAEYAGKLTLSDADYTSLVSQGNMAISKTNFTKWQNNLDDVTAKDLTAQLGVDVKTADYNTVKVALNTYKQAQAQPTTQPQTNNVAMPQTNTLAQANTPIMANTQATAQQMQNPVAQAIRDKVITEKEVNNINTFIKGKNVGINYFYDKSETAVNGYYKNGVISVNLASKEGAYETAVHEYAHYIEETAPNLLNDYLKQVDTLIKTSDKYKAIADKWTKEYKTNEKTKDISDKELRVEVALKISKHLIDNNADFKAIVNNDLTVGQRLLLWFKNMFNRFNKNGLTAEANAVKKAVEALQTAIKAKTEQKAEVKTEVKADNKYSLPDTDSQGRKLTKEQQEFFNGVDSVVKTNNNELKVFYHGTPRGGFTVFSGGSYFTENKAYAKIYEGSSASSISYKKTTNPMTYEVYLNIKNPFDTRKAKIRKIYDAEFKNKSGEDWVNNAPLTEKGLPDWTDGYDLMEFIKEKGYSYDALILDEGATGGYGEKVESRGISYVPFSSSQIKLTTNLNPTANEDIRYSLADTAYKADVITNVYEEVDGKKTLVSKTLKGATVTEKDGYYQIKTADGTIKRKIGAKGTFVMNGTVETTRDKVLTSVDKDLTMRERLNWNRVKAKTGEFWQNLRIAFVDEQAGIVDEFKRLGVKNGEDVVQFARSAKAAGEQMLFTSQFNYKGEEVGESLETILRPVLKDEKYKQDFYYYLHSKHNIDRLAQGKPVFKMTAEESQKVVDQYEKSNPEFVDMAAKVYKYLDNLLQYQVDTGMISQELADDLRKKYPHYVPTYRDTEGAKLGTGSIEGKYNLAIKSVLKTAIGSDLAILPLDITIPAMTMKTIKAARLNTVAKSMYDAAAAKDDFTNIEITSTEKVDESIQDTDLDEYKPLNNEVTFFDNGKRVTMKVEKKIFTGFDAFAPDVAVYSGLENMLRAVNSGFKRLVTSYNPAFFIRNPVRDIQDAALYSKYPKQLMKNYAKAFNEIRTNSFLWRQYKAMGGLGVSLFDYNKGFSGTLNKWGLTKAEVKVFGKILQGVENANIVAEQLPRFAEYISTIEAGKSVERALLNAADITVNFGRKGLIGKRLNATIMPFLNPAIQGFSKMVRTITAARSQKAIVGLLTKAIILGIVPQLLNQLMYNDDDEYKQLNDRDKENNYLIKIGGKFIKIPRGRVLSVLGGLAMRTAQTAQGEKADWGGYVKNISQQVTPVENFSRTIASPFTDVANNLTWYGTAIEGRQFENIEPKKRYDESTSSIAIAMGKVLNYSPKKINYLLDQYSGVIGDFILPATTKRAEKDFLSGNFTIDPTLQNKLSADFFKAYDKAQYAKSNGDENATYQVRYLNRVKSAVSDLFEQKRMIENSNLTDKEKRAETKAVQMLINEAYKTALVDLPLVTSAIAATSSIDDDNIRYAETMRLTYGAERALREYNSAVYAKAQSLNDAKIDYDTYYQAYFTIKGIDGRKDIKGNVIAGTKKTEVLKYVKQLNLNTTQKQLLLYSQGYSVATNDFYGVTSSTAKQSVISYINRLTISAEQKEALAKTCGFNFKNGRVIA